jgi:hypothetical protein
MLGLPCQDALVAWAAAGPGTASGPSLLVAPAVPVLSPELRLRMRAAVTAEGWRRSPANTSARAGNRMGRAAPAGASVNVRGQQQSRPGKSSADNRNQRGTYHRRARGPGCRRTQARGPAAAGQTATPGRAPPGHAGLAVIIIGSLPAVAEKHFPGSDRPGGCPRADCRLGRRADPSAAPVKEDLSPTHPHRPAHFSRTESAGSCHRWPPRRAGRGGGCALSLALVPNRVDGLCRCSTSR